MDKAIRLINEYCKKEFDSPGNFANMDHIELAYEPDEETGLSGIEAYADLETFRRKGTLATFHSEVLKFQTEDMTNTILRFMTILLLKLWTRYVPEV